MRHSIKEGQAVRRDRDFALWVLALAGAGIVLLVVDVLVLILLLLPTAASARRTPAELPEGPQLALILPTHDPRTPWPTRTPALTATPRPMPSATLELPTIPAPTERSVEVSVTGEPATPEQTEGTSLPLSAPTLAIASSPARPSASILVTTPTPNQGAAAGPSMPPPGSVVPPGPAAETPDLPETSGERASETPSPVPPTTPEDNAGQTPAPLASLDTLGDLPDLEAYLRQHRSAIAGQPLEIVSLTMDATNAAVPRFVLEVAGSEGGDVLAAQPAASLLEYGRVLLEDAKRYLGDAECAVVVESTYRTASSEACSQAAAWCQVGPFDEAANTWTVTRAYVRAVFSGGLDAVEAWNGGP